MICLISSALFFGLVYSLNSDCVVDHAKYQSVQTLDASVQYNIRHKVEDGYLHLALEANINGWLGFGFAEHGSMKGLDLDFHLKKHAGIVPQFCVFIANQNWSSHQCCAVQTF